MLDNLKEICIFKKYRNRVKTAFNLKPFVSSILSPTYCIDIFPSDCLPLEIKSYFTKYLYIDFYFKISNSLHN